MVAQEPTWFRADVGHWSIKSHKGLGFRMLGNAESKWNLQKLADPCYRHPCVK